MDSYLESMAEAARTVATRYGRCAYAEGWRRHNHMGYGPPDFAPMQELLADAVTPVVPCREGGGACV
jgi:hypothetical protein